MHSMRQVAKSLLRPLPGEGKTIKAGVRRALVQKELLVAKARQRLAGVTLPDPRTIYHIDPRRIEFATCLDNGSSDWEDWVLPQKGSVKRIQGGDWDLLQHRVADMRITRAVRERIHDGSPWNATDYYRTAVQQIQRGRQLWSCTSAADFDKHCEQVDRLIDSISTTGYQPCSANGTPVSSDTATGQGEILVNLSRDGLPLFQDGRHRLAIALALGLQSIPIQVHVRHTEWQVFREYLLQMARSADRGASAAGSLYQPAVHFDLSEIPFGKSSQERWNAIAAQLPSAGTGYALDIGCNLGFMCHGLEQRGYTVTGVEYMPEIALAARRIAVSEGRKFQIITGDILDEQTLQPAGSNFDVVIALSIFHHFIKTEAGFNKLRNLLGRLQIGTLYFEPHEPTDPQMQGQYANPAPEEFVQLVAGWAGLTKYEPLYTGSDGRTVFALQR